MLASTDEVRVIAHNNGKPLKQYSLANAQGWIKYFDTQKKNDSLINTHFFSKIIRNEKMDRLLREILGFVVRDFILIWFKTISPNPQFLAYVDYILHYAVAELYSRILNIDANQLILIKICGILTNHIQEYQNAERLLRASRLNTSKDPDEMNRQLSLHYLQGKLHPALTATAPDTLPSEYSWLRKRLKPLIPHLIPRKEASNGIITVLLREILIICLIRPAVNNFSQPDYWNQLGESWGGYLLEQQHQSHLLRKPSEYLPDIFDSSSTSPTKNTPPSFDAYLRQISACSSLADAYKIRDNILVEIEKKGASIEGCASDDIINGTKVSKIQGYINRLQIALKRVDKVIAKLSLKGSSPIMLARKLSRDLLGTSGNAEILTLNQVLDDSSLIPFFDDFLSMIGRNALLQFYVAVNAFQDQLCIDKTIISLQEELDANIIETWDFVGVSVNVCDLYKDFFANDAILKISQFISPHIVQTLEKYVDQVQIDLVNADNASNLAPPNFSNNDSTLIGVKCILVALHETLVIFRKEDFPAFLKHSIGQKLLSRLTGSSNPLRFLRSSKSPERPSLDQQRLSMESDRSIGGDVDEEFDFAKLQKRLSGLLLSNTKKMMGKMGGSSKAKSVIEDKDIFQATGSPTIIDSELTNVEGELLGIINSEENSFAPPSTSSADACLSSSAPNSARKKMNRLSPFFGDYKMQQKAEDIAHSGKAFLNNFRFKKIEADKTPQSKIQDKSKVSSPLDENGFRVGVDTTGHIIPSRTVLKDADTENFIQLEIEDQQTVVPVDEDILVDQNSDSLPPMIILPARFFELDGTLENLQKYLEDIEKETKEIETGNDTAKLKLLNYTKRGIWQEIQEVMNEKQKIERLELENVILSGRCSVKMQESNIISQNGKEYAVYPLHVSRCNEEGTASGWMIFRRYSQFLSLHQDLKAKHPFIMQNYELPGKMMSGIMKGRGHFMKTRRQALEEYLQKLLSHQEICKSSDFRRFICHPQIIKLLYGFSGELDESPSKKSFIRSVFNSVDSTVDALFQKRRKSRSNILHLGPSNVFSHNPVSSVLSSSTIDENDATSSTEPIIDFFVALFEIKGLRRQAIVIFLQNLFGDTVEKRVTETLKDALSQEKMETLLTSIRDTYWPSGIWSTNQISRTDDQKIKSKFESSSKLIQLFPELFGGIVGRQNSRKGAIRIVTVFQNPRLNQHLMYTILDQILFMLFPK